MHREITNHKVNVCNDNMTIQVLDEPGSGGANHVYFISGFRYQNPAYTDDETAVRIQFQNGPIKEVGTNGVTHEALLAIVEDRLKGFQSGPYACQENADALFHVGYFEVLPCSFHLGDRYNGGNQLRYFLFCQRHIAPLGFLYSPCKSVGIVDWLGCCFHRIA